MVNLNNYCQMQYWYIFQKSKLLPNVQFFDSKKIKVFVKSSFRNFFLYANNEPLINNSYRTLQFYDLNLVQKIFQICNELVWKLAPRLVRRILLGITYLWVPAQVKNKIFQKKEILVEYYGTPFLNR